MRRFLSISIGLFGAILALPLFQAATGIPRDVPLAGVESAVARPPPGLAAWWNGTLQSGFDAWFNQNLGLRGCWVRTANQLNYTLFRELPRRSGTQVLMGRDGFLYE